jgi:hypothetical protein
MKATAIAILSAGALLAPGTAQDVKPAIPIKPAGQPAATIQPAPAPPQKSQEELRKLREEKLGKPVFKKADWVFDFDAAKARAAAEGKVILTYFTRSYAG